ncbi:type II secretion system ATPase GspE [Candidatus Dependentiae bacterium]|nr:type II secretion system ATPase GspE [Candidatus Dependentiae bacterium]
MAKQSFADFLMNAGYITVQQAHECSQESKQAGISFEDCLLTKEYLSPELLAQQLAAFTHFPYLESISEKMIDLTLLAKVPLRFLREHAIMPIIYEGQPTILTTRPLQFQPIDEINLLLGGNLITAVATEKIIVEAVNRYYPLEGTKQVIEELEEERAEEGVAFEAIDERDLLTMETEAPIIKLVNHVLFQAAKRGASDIHIEPFEKELSIRYRIDGIMYHVMNPPKRIQGALVSRVKIMAGLNIAEKRIPQDGRIEIKIADKAIDIRVSVLPVVFGERIVMRLLDKTRSFARIEEIGMSERDLRIVKKTIARPNGIFYITGPTGSGKTTTLYSILYELNTPDVNIVTVEDPVEYQMPGIGQVQVREKVGLTFASALRSILRQDPDIVMIGETRDQETAQIAIQAALTGHLVLSTLHTNSAPASITRLIDMGLEPFLIASSVVSICAQRLVRKLCIKCKQSYQPSLELLRNIGLTADTARGIIFYQAVGCEECNNTGYKGRMAIFEIMEISPEIAKLTMARADTTLLRKQAVQDGMTLLIEDGVRKIKQGLTTIEEVLSVAAIEQGAEEI